MSVIMSLFSPGEFLAVKDTATMTVLLIRTIVPETSLE